MRHFHPKIHRSRALYRRKKYLPKRPSTKRMSKNYLESILLKVYEDNMPADDQVELLQRTVVILAMALAFDERLTFREMVVKQDGLIIDAKTQALSDMQIARRSEDNQ